MMKAWEKNIRKVVPYVPGEQPNKERMIKLNTNENPYPPAPGVAEALKNLDPDRLRLYPDPACTRLVDAIAKQKGLKPEQIFVGVGSDDVLAMCFMTFFNSEKPILPMEAVKYYQAQKALNGESGEEYKDEMPEIFW